MELKDLEVISYRLQKEGWSKHELYESEVILEQDDESWIVKMWHDPSDDYHYLDDAGKFSTDKYFFYSPEEAVAAWELVPSKERFRVLKNGKGIQMITATSLVEAIDIAKARITSAGLQYQQEICAAGELIVELPFHDYVKYKIVEINHEDP